MKPATPIRGSMYPTIADFERSVRRAPARERVLVTLSSLTITYRGPLARAAGVSWSQLEGVLFGSPPKYSEALSLVALGLARAVDTPGGLAIEITERGRRKARQLTARKVRVVARREAMRKVFDHLPPPIPGGRLSPAPVGTIGVDC